ncbi:MAG: hypothetical protein R2838_21965 [Caldilineaceae bacterium]
MRPILEIQARHRTSALGELLIETTQSRDGHHIFVYPLAGRLVPRGAEHAGRLPPGPGHALHHQRLRHRLRL